MVYHSMAISMMENAEICCSECVYTPTIRTKGTYQDSTRSYLRSNSHFKPRMILQETTNVKAPPKEVYRFFEEMEGNYERWHPDHITYRWTEGIGMEQGTEAYFEERIAGKLQKKTVTFVEVTPDRYIEFKPTSLLVGLLMPHISFTIDARSDGCELTQRIKVRTGPIGARLNKREFDAVRTHMREEGENLKRILETED